VFDILKSLFTKTKSSTDLTTLVEGYFSSTVDNISNPTFYAGLAFIVNTARTFTWRISQGGETKAFSFADYFSTHDDCLQNFVFGLYTNGISGIAINRKTDKLESTYRNITYVYGLVDGERYLDLMVLLKHFIRHQVHSKR